MSLIPLFEHAVGHRNATAVIDDSGQYSYRELLNLSSGIAAGLLAGSVDLAEQRIAFLFPPGVGYVSALWGIWRAGGVAVPLGLTHPTPELEYVLDDTEASTLLVDTSLIDRVSQLAQDRGLRLLHSNDHALQASTLDLPDLSIDRRAMILYTSGTTSRPKGVVSTHANIQAQVESLVAAWQWTENDHILHALPLHHIHGIINVLTCSLWAGAKCEILPQFDSARVWERIAQGGLTLFMAVPTIYSKLIAAWADTSAPRQAAMSFGCTAMRLMVSGSAALPVTTLERWHTISGHVLLERYGMTEIGMALSNPLTGERVPGHVGMPLPNVEVRRLNEQGSPASDDQPAELEVRGPTVFQKYWNQPEATAKAFRDDWFRTGDVTVVQNGVYRILGRNSVDIIKTGGYKVSALEIEEVLRTHPDIQECAVVGIDDPEWGQRVAACLVLTGTAEMSLETLRQWTKERLASYKVPSCLKTVDALPRNAMGKVQKPVIVRLFPETTDDSSVRSEKI